MEESLSVVLAVAGLEGAEATERPIAPNLTLIFFALVESSPAVRSPLNFKSFWIRRSGLLFGVLRRRTNCPSCSSSSRRRFSPIFAPVGFSEGDWGRLRVIRARASKGLSSSSSSFDDRFGGGPDVANMVGGIDASGEEERDLDDDIDLVVSLITTAEADSSSSSSP